MEKIRLQYYFILLLLFAAHVVIAQRDSVYFEGSISFKTSSNVYVKFAKPLGLKTGDTVYIKESQIYNPSLLVVRASSLSTVCSKLKEGSINIGDKVYAKEIPVVKPIQEQAEVDSNEIDVPITKTPLDTQETIAPTLHRTEQVNARFSISTNGELSKDKQEPFKGLRVVSNVRVTNIQRSKFSIESYFTYKHRYGVEQSSVEFFDEFKVLSLAVQYAIHPKSNIYIGRRVHSNLANMGASDGIQYDHTFGKTSVGFLFGARPSIFNYEFNFNNLQAGVFAAYQHRAGSSSIAVVEQRNHNIIDRRFTYLQHSSELLKNVYLFASTELDLYKKKDSSSATSAFDLTSFYASLRYRFNRSFSLTASYDNRKNIFYYETYKYLLDKYIDEATREGMRFQVSYNIPKFATINASSFLRFESGAIVSKNYYLSWYFPNIAKSRIRSSISGSYFDNSYVSGFVISAKADKDFFKSKLNIELNGRHNNYVSFGGEQRQADNYAGLGLTYYLTRMTNVLCNFETNLNDLGNYNVYYLTIVQRIKTKSIKK